MDLIACSECLQETLFMYLAIESGHHSQQSLSILITLNYPYLNDLKLHLIVSLSDTIANALHYGINESPR